MTTYTATNAAVGVAVPGHGFAKSAKRVTSTYSPAGASWVATDIVQMVRVPKGAIITGGRFFGTKMETTSSGAVLDIDVGWEANGTDVADPDGLGNFGVLITTAVAGVKPEVDVFTLKTEKPT